MFVFVLFQLVACDDTIFPGGGEPIDGEGWCGVENLIAAECLVCHSASSALGGLDLETDPTLVLSLRGISNDVPFVVPGSPEESLLYRKVANETVAGDGGVMPPTGAPAQPVIDNLADWITDGATIDTCP